MDDIEAYGRAAARVAGLRIDEASWPGVIRHLGVMLERAGSLDGELDHDRVPLPDDPGPVFAP